MRASLRKDLTVALKARNDIAVTALRCALAAIDNTEAVPVDCRWGTRNEHGAGAAIGPGAVEVERRHLTDADLRAIVENEVRERSAAARKYEELGRADLGAKLRAEADVLSRYLKPPL
jgi:uncharacterized protein YqeY